jgi:hypothetical protein
MPRHAGFFSTIHIQYAIERKGTCGSVFRAWKSGHTERFAWETDHTLHFFVRGFRKYSFTVFQLIDAPFAFL